MKKGTANNCLAYFRLHWHLLDLFNIYFHIINERKQSKVYRPVNSHVAAGSLSVFKDFSSYQGLLSFFLLLPAPSF